MDKMVSHFFSLWCKIPVDTSGASGKNRIKGNVTHNCSENAGTESEITKLLVDRFGIGLKCFLLNFLWPLLSFIAMMLTLKYIYIYGVERSS